MGRHRRELLAEVAGDVLEIGFGTGLNLPYYSSDVRRLCAIEPNPGMLAIAAKRHPQAPFPVELFERGGEDLPFAASQFDCVVSTWTLCSIPDVAAALAEIRRVLKPEGRFYFVEHGLSQEPGVGAWQRRLTPIQKCIGDGCHLDRDMAQLVQNAGFSLRELRTFYLENTPKVLGYLYQGAAAKAALS